MKIAIALSAALWLASSPVSRCEAAYMPGQPSIDCTKAHNAVAIILCSSPEAAEADWAFNSVWWAHYFSVNEERRRTLDADQQAWRQSLERICGLPRRQTPGDQEAQAMAQVVGRMMLGRGITMPGPQPITRAHAICVLNAYRTRTAILRSKLRGHALAESRLTPAQHFELQDALTEKGFLGADEVDGEFGPITRVAIKQFQQSIRAAPTGFLSGDQRTALLETPEQREAKAAAELNARLEAERRVAQADAERKARQEAETKRLEAEEAEKNARQEAEKKRLEAEAEAAKEWGRRTADARARGPEYAAQLGLKWSISEKLNPMTDENDYEVSSVQPNGTGAQALVEGTCQKPGRVVFLASLHDSAEPGVPLGLPTFHNGTVTGQKRFNDGPVFATAFPTAMFRNRIVVSTLTSLDPTESIEATWRVLAQVETTRGPLTIKIPLFDENVQKLLAACKKQGEIAKRREGVTDGLLSH